MTFLHRKQKVTPRQEQAAYWFAVISSDEATDVEQDEFKCWINESEENRHSYQKIQQVWQCFDDIDQNNQSNNSQILNQALDGCADSKKYASTIRNSAINLCLLFVCLWIGLDSNIYYKFSSDLSTFDGRLSTHLLEDGSQIILDAGSAIDIQYSQKERRLFLYRGRVHATVASNPNRPFIIETTSAVATALGTAFSVSTESDGTQLAVTESRVTFCTVPNDNQRTTVHCVKATEGEGSNVNKGYLSLAKNMDLSIETAWLNNRLVVNDQPLASVLDQLDKYNSGLLIYNKHNLKGVNISGVFPTNDITTVISMLSQNSNVKTIRLSGVSIIVSKI
jgi:transmembrane sensor